jgi:uncharacterized membrane protein YhaH (DUF805 family)
MSGQSSGIGRWQYAREASVAICLILVALSVLPSLMGGFDQKSFSAFTWLFQLIIGSLIILGKITSRRSQDAGLSPWLTTLPVVLIFGAGYFFLFKNIENFDPNYLHRDLRTIFVAMAPGALSLAVLFFV